MKQPQRNESTAAEGENKEEEKKIYSAKEFNDAQVRAWFSGWLSRDQIEKERQDALLEEKENLLARSSS